MIFGNSDTKRFVLGYDLGEKVSQISYLASDADMPETLSVLAGSELYNIPTVLCKRSSVNQWFYGKEAVRHIGEGDGIAVRGLISAAKEGKPVKWLAENSWGIDSGYNGKLIMTDEWFNEYMFRLVAEKKYIPSDILKVLNSKPELLPAWDPMFEPED